MKVCIIHKEKAEGVPVRDDMILRTIRSIKKALKLSTGNTLVVCKAHLGEARKRREKFEKSLMTSAGIGAVLGLILLLATLFSAKSLVNILETIVLIVFLVLVMAAFSLYQYFPVIDEKRSAVKAKAETSRKKRR